MLGSLSLIANAATTGTSRANHVSAPGRISRSRCWVCCDSGIALDRAIICTPVYPSVTYEPECPKNQPTPPSTPTRKNQRHPSAEVLEG